MMLDELSLGEVGEAGRVWLGKLGLVVRGLSI